MLGAALSVGTIALLVAVNTAEMTSLFWFLGVLTLVSTSTLLTNMRYSGWGVAAAIALGSLAAFLLAFPVLGVAQEVSQTDAFLLTVSLPLLVLPLIAGALFVRPWRRQPGPLFEVLLSIIAAAFVYFAIAPRGCNESDPPECVSFLGRKFTGEPDLGDLALGALVAAAATFALARVLRRLIDGIAAARRFRA